MRFRLLSWVAGIVLIAGGCGAAEVLRLADATASGCQAFRRQGAIFSLKRQCSMTMRMMTPEAALTALQQGKLEAVLLDRTALPENAEQEFRIFPAAVRAAVIYVNLQNSCTELKSSEISALLKNVRPTWQPITGNTEDVHLFALKPEVEGGGVWEKCFFPAGETPPCPMLRLGSSRSLRILVSGDPLAMGFGLYSEEKNPKLRMLAIDDVQPTPENLRSGKYPLTELRVLVLPRSPNEIQRKFGESMQSREWRKLITDSGELPGENLKEE